MSAAKRPRLKCDACGRWRGLSKLAVVTRNTTAVICADDPGCVNVFNYADAMGGHQ